LHYPFPASIVCQRRHGVNRLIYSRLMARPPKSKCLPASLRYTNSQGANFSNPNNNPGFTAPTEPASHPQPGLAHTPPGKSSPVLTEINIFLWKRCEPKTRQDGARGAVALY